MVSPNLRISARLFLGFGLLLLFIGALTALAAAGVALVWIVACGVVFLLLGAICGWWITRSIVGPLNQAIDIAKRVTQGDLTATVDIKTSNDETGELLRALSDLSERMFKVVSNVRMGTTAIATASGQLSSDNAALSFRTESQASSLEETAASMEELTSAVKQNAENAKQANELVLSASGFAVKGGQVVSDVVQTMGSIKQSSHQISDIIGVIDGIAFQTNILALNAAVEAAHAGEQGRGFAAVATEVRNLAQRSAGAAKEIKTLIANSVKQVDAGSKLVDQAGKSMDEIVGSFQHVADIISEISAASQEQRAGIEEINQAIMQIDQMTQKNGVLVDEASKSGASLHEHAVALSHTVSLFNLGAAEHGNADDAVEMVKRGLDYFNANGKEALMEDVNRLHKGQFIDRDLYLSIYALEDGVVLANGANSRVIGLPRDKVKDVDGKYFTVDMLSLAKGPGSGWVDYKWAHPLTKEIKLKSAYLERVGDVFVACGYYK
jgi:methyl-accepting chemotaxis protein